jgi:hypothetical protein
MGALSENKAFLFVNGMTSPFSAMRYSPDFVEYDNKILACSYTNDAWHFHRLRTDRSFPNAKETAFDIIDALKRPITKQALCDLIVRQSKNNICDANASSTT